MLTLMLISKMIMSMKRTINYQDETYCRSSNSQASYIEVEFLVWPPTTKNQFELTSHEDYDLIKSATIISVAAGNQQEVN